MKMFLPLLLPMFAWLAPTAPQTSSAADCCCDVCPPQCTCCCNCGG